MKKCLGLFILIMLIIICLIFSCNGNQVKDVDARFVINDEVVEDSPGGIWVEVSLTNEEHKVIVREDKEVIREMICSGGTPDEPTLLGTFNLENRGSWFYSERFKEGATYWVRITEQYLFHGIPRNKEWEIIQEELDKLGGPASHGCIRLSEDDAKWFYDNVPDGTTVIIHD